MIHQLKQLNEINDLLEDKNLILIHPDHSPEAIKIIKQWIAEILAKHYDKDPRKMIEANKHITQFKCIKWLDKDEIILITHK